MAWKEYGSWFNAVPETSLDLRMEGKVRRVAVGWRIGASLVQSLVCCHCGEQVDVMDTHGEARVAIQSMPL